MIFTIDLTPEELATSLYDTELYGDPTESEAFKLIVALDRAQESYEFTQALIEHLQRELDIEDESAKRSNFPE